VADQNNVVINFIGNTDSLQASLVEVGKEAVAVGKVSQAAFNDFNKANQQADAGIQKTTGDLQNLNKVVSSGAVKEYSKDLQGAVEKLYDQGKIMEALILKYGSASKALKEMQKELNTMAALGQRNTSAFKDLTKVTAELQDTIGDTRGEIKKLASDTKVFDSLVQSARGVAAAFSVGTGVMAAFGSENEDVQKTLLKVQGAMAALQGVQELANIATEKGGIVTQAYGSALTAVEFIQKRFAISSAAAWAAATGGVTLLFAAVGALIYWLSNASDAQEKLNEDLKEYDKLSEEINEKQRENRKSEVENYYRQKILNSKTEREAILLEIEMEEKLGEAIKQKINFQKQATEAALAGGGANNPYYVELKNALDKSLKEELDYEEKVKALRDKLAKEDSDREKKSLDNYLKNLRERQKADEAYILSLLNAYDEADEKLRAALKNAGDNTELSKEQRIQYYFLAGMDKDEIAQRLSSILSQADKDAADVLNSRIKDTQYNRAYFQQIWEDDNKKKAQEQLALDKAISSASIQIAQQTADAIFEIERNERQSEVDAQIKKLDEKKEKELSDKNLTEAQKNQISLRYAKEEARIKTIAWEADKQAKIQQATINGALAVTRVFADSPPVTPAQIALDAVAVALIAATTAVQIGVIQATKPPAFAKGTEYVGLNGAPRGTDTIHAMLNEGERVVPTHINRKLKGISNDDLPKLMEAYYAPMPHAPELSGMNIVVAQEPIDYKKLARAFADELRASPQTHLHFDRNGFALNLIEKGKNVQILNSRYDG